MGLAWRPDGKEVWVTGTTSGIARYLIALTPTGMQRTVYRVPARSRSDLSRTAARSSPKRIPEPSSAEETADPSATCRRSTGPARAACRAMGRSSASTNPERAVATAERCTSARWTARRRYSSVRVWRADSPPTARGSRRCRSTVRSSPLSDRSGQGKTYPLPLATALNSSRETKRSLSAASRRPRTEALRARHSDGKDPRDPEGVPEASRSCRSPRWPIVSFERRPPHGGLLIDGKPRSSPVPSRETTRPAGARMAEASTSTAGERTLPRLPDGSGVEADPWKGDLASRSRRHHRHRPGGRLSERRRLRVWGHPDSLDAVPRRRPEVSLAPDSRPSPHDPASGPSRDRIRAT